MTQNANCRGEIQSTQESNLNCKSAPKYFQTVESGLKNVNIQSIPFRCRFYWCSLGNDPCLREPACFSYSYSWEEKLKLKKKLITGQFKELVVNSLKFKPKEDAYPAKNMKRPGWAKDNHFMSLHSGEAPESLGKERISLLLELQKKNQLEMQ